MFWCSTTIIYLTIQRYPMIFYIILTIYIYWAINIYRIDEITNHVVFQWAIAICLQYDVYHYVISVVIGYGYRHNWWIGQHVTCCNCIKTSTQLNSQAYHLQYSWKAKLIFTSIFIVRIHNIIFEYHRLHVIHDKCDKRVFKLLTILKIH